MWFDLFRFEGEMSAEVNGPNGPIPISIVDSVVGRKTVVFKPHDEGNYRYLYIYNISFIVATQAAVCLFSILLNTLNYNTLIGFCGI